MTKNSASPASARPLRTVLLATAATMSIMVGAGAHAQSANLDDPTNAYRTAQAAGALVPVSDYLDPQIVITDPPAGTQPPYALDPVDVTGVGQMIIDEQTGFIGLCTGTLINPRTVILAAHCVNERPANAYGENSGGQPIGFGFGSNNNVRGASAFGGWLSDYATNTARYMYDANYVAYNPGSLEPDAASFLYSDVALATLDTPAQDVPTWALLFSALPATDITADGTGYHVVIDGYGNNGTASTGSTGGIDYRRRIAENTLGALASLDAFESFVFGEPNGLYQNLYWIDFDDPRRGTGTESPFDFNAWRDNAQPNEGITASGDSGGPLILDDTFAKQLVIGVLSGGYTRFFNGQPANGYGTASFYQPLYLYWDWIAANNPYHYVSAKAGNGDWTDPTHWTTNLDPSYQIIDDAGNLVNGVPTTPGAGTAPQPGFGQACFESGGISDCLDIATGDETVVERPIGEASAAGPVDDRGTATSASLGGGAATAAAVAQDDDAVAALPAPTLLNGLPGATGFVPDNDDGDRLTSTAPRYFDVTLSATGITTLDSAVTVDRFGIAGAGAILDIAPEGSLTSLMDINQMTGGIRVDGLLSTPGDYFMLSGGLSGSGTINAPFFTSVAGTIAPGTATTIGTLTFKGDVILASGTQLAINLGANGLSDRVAVQATTFDGDVPTNGTANLGGVVSFTPAAGYTIRAGDAYTFLTTEAPLTGEFDAALPISAILTPHLAYGDLSVSVTIDAGLYADVVGTTPVQTAYAGLLDRNRTVYDRLADLYGILDMQDAATIRSTLEGLAPRTETTRNALGTVSIDNMSRFYRDHLASLDAGNLGGSIAMIGQPFQIAAVRASGMPTRPGSADVRSDAGDTLIQEGRLPETMSAFIAGGYLDGDSAGMPGAVPATGRDSFDGLFIAAGVESEVGPRGVIGFSFSYTDLDATPSLASQKASSELILGTLYGKLKTGSGVFVDASASAGVFLSTTVRDVNLAGPTYRLTGKDQSMVVSGELGVGRSFDLGGFTLDPRIAARGTRIMFDRIAETGGDGGPALVYQRDSLDSLQGRAGLGASGGGTIRPYVSAYYVHDFVDQPAGVGANFVGGVGPNALFAVAGADDDWGEVSGGIAYATKTVEVSVGADTTIGRSDVSNQSYHGTVKIRF